MIKVVLIIFLGLVLRLISLNQSFWLDEATTANVANMGVNQILTVFSLGDFHPPLYYIIVHYWVVLFGSSEVGIRVLSVLAGLGTILTTYLIGKNLKGKKEGTVAAILLATSGLHIYYSQEARMYALSAFFVSLTFLYFVKILKSGRVGEWLLFSLFITLSVFTDYLPILIIPAMWIYAFIVKKDLSWWKKFTASHIILIGTSLFWLPTFVKQLTGGLLIKTHSPSWWQILGKVNFKQLVLIPTKFIFGRIDMQASTIQILFVGIVFLFFGLVLIKSLKELKVTKIVWFWLCIPLLLAGVISFWIPVLSYFRFLFVLPAFYLLVSFGLRKLSKTIFKPTVIILLVFNLATSAFYLFGSKNHREDWRGLTGFISEESSDKNSAVVFVADSQQEAYRYYDKDAKILTAKTVDENYDQLWLMRYVKDVFDSEDMTKIKIESLGYKKINEYDFNGVVVWRYEHK